LTAETLPEWEKRRILTTDSTDGADKKLLSSSAPSVLSAVNFFFRMKPKLGLARNATGRSWDVGQAQNSLKRRPQS
jgi:hypothetical protein